MKTDREKDGQRNGKGKTERERQKKRKTPKAPRQTVDLPCAPGKITALGEDGISLCSALHFLCFITLTSQIDHAVISYNTAAVFE